MGKRLAPAGAAVVLGVLVYVRGGPMTIGAQPDDVFARQARLDEDRFRNATLAGGMGQVRRTVVGMHELALTRWNAAGP